MSEDFKKNAKMMGRFDAPILLCKDRHFVRTVEVTAWANEIDGRYGLDISDLEGVQGCLFHGESMKVALDELRLAVEGLGYLLAVEGSLVYASYSGMCHGAGGFRGYKMEVPNITELPSSVETLEPATPNLFKYISTVEEQNIFDDSGEEKTWRLKKFETDYAESSQPRLLPLDEEIKAAKQSPNGNIFRIDPRYDPDGYVPIYAIFGC